MHKKVICALSTIFLCSFNVLSQNCLYPGDRINVNQYLYSQSGEVHLVYQSDLNIVVYQNGGGPLWDCGHVAAGTCVYLANSPGYMTLQTDSNLVAFDSGGPSYWSSRTNGNTLGYLNMQNNGALILYGASGNALGSSLGTTISTSNTNNVCTNGPTASPIAQPPYSTTVNPTFRPTMSVKPAFSFNVSKGQRSLMVSFWPSHSLLRPCHQPCTQNIGKYSLRPALQPWCHPNTQSASQSAFPTCGRANVLLLFCLHLLTLLTMSRQLSAFGDLVAIRGFISEACAQGLSHLSSQNHVGAACVSVLSQLLHHRLDLSVLSQLFHHRLDLSVLSQLFHHRFYLSGLSQLLQHIAYLSALPSLGRGIVTRIHSPSYELQHKLPRTFLIILMPFVVIFPIILTLFALIFLIFAALFALECSYTKAIFGPKLVVRQPKNLKASWRVISLVSLIWLQSFEICSGSIFHPSAGPSPIPSALPSRIPTPKPSPLPSPKPSFRPTSPPRPMPTSQPSLSPSSQPTSQPSVSSSTLLSFTSLNWTMTASPSRMWNSVAISSTGQYMTATSGEDIWISSNYGSNWVQASAPGGGWGALATSDSGEYQIAIRGYELWASRDLGRTWLPASGVSEPWTSVAMSSTGEYVTAVADWNHILLSRDYGETWHQSPAPLQPYRAVAMSAQGDLQTVGVAGGDGIGISSDGIDWTTTGAGLFTQQVRMSSTGQYQIGIMIGGGANVIMISRDYGVSWARSSAPVGNWKDISMSGTGEIQVAVVYGGGIWLSVDYGKTWRLSTAPSQSWQAVAMSSDSTQMIAAVSGGGLYVYSTVPAPSLNPPVVCQSSARLLHRYSFNDGTLGDSIAGSNWTAALMATASLDNGQVTCGSGGCAALPGGLFGSYKAVTIEAWVTTGANNADNVIFEFGSSSLNAKDSIFVARNEKFGLKSGNFKLSWYDAGGLTCPGHCHEFVSNHSFSMQSSVHIVVTIMKGANANLYINGVFEGTASVNVSSLPSPLNFFIGKGSIGSALIGSVDEFRVWGGGLTSACIANNYAQGPDAPGPTLMLPINLAPSTLFSYTGNAQSYTVSSGVASIQVDARAAQGGSGTGTYTSSVEYPGGLGGRIVASLSVTPGQILVVNVGGHGGSGLYTNMGGFNGGGQGSVYVADSSAGGGGGGASDVRSSTSLSSRLVVAGGGGGAGRNEAGSPGGGFIGGGHMSVFILGGSQSEGGAGGGCADWALGKAGLLGLGGDAAVDGGAGGGGYYGGGAAGWCGYGAGGGSSFSSGVISVNSQGYQSGDGSVSIVVIGCSPGYGFVTFSCVKCPTGSFSVGGTSSCAGHSTTQLGCQSNALLLHRYAFNDGRAADLMGGKPWAGVVGTGASVGDDGQVTCGNSSCVTLPSDSNILCDYTSITVEAWVTTGINDAYNVIFGFGSSSSTLADSLFLMRHNFFDGSLALSWFDPDGTRCSHSDFDPTDNCHEYYSNHPFSNQTDMHIVVTASAGDYARLYVNGMLMGATPVVLTAVPSPKHFVIGQSFNGSESTLVGSIDEFRIWGGVLSAACVAKNYEDGPNSALLDPVLTHRYSFNSGTAADSIGGHSYDGTVMAGATLFGGQAVFNRSGPYVRLPKSVFGAATAVTIEAWVTTGFNNSGSVKVFQFGPNVHTQANSVAIGRNYKTGNVMKQYFPPNQTVQETSTLTSFNTQTDLYVALTISSACSAALYVNGTYISTTSAPYPLKPTKFYIGKSFNVSDRGFIGSVNEFRIWSGILTPSQIAQNFHLGPNSFSTSYRMSTVYGLPLTTEFFFTGFMQTYVVPADVATVVVDAKGAQGGSAGYQGGKGGHITATIPVYQGQVLYVYVGGMGRSGASVNGNGFNGGGSAASTWGYNWGGGGGASDVRTSPYDLQSRFVVAGGGGGAGGNGGGGAGGGVVGGSGSGWCGITSLGGSYFKGGDGSGGGQAGGLGFGGGAIYDGGGGGGGYYGGGAGGWCSNSGAGGSSFSVGNITLNTQNYEYGGGCVSITAHTHTRGKGYTQSTVCASVQGEGETATLTCPSNGQVTAITFASYGNPTGSCGAPVYGSCHAPSSIDIVKQACMGRQWCSVFASDLIFGRPCMDNTEGLFFQAICTQRGSLAPSPSPSPPPTLAPTLFCDPDANFGGNVSTYTAPSNLLCQGSIRLQSAPWVVATTSAVGQSSAQSTARGSLQPSVQPVSAGTSDSVADSALIEAWCDQRRGFRPFPVLGSAVAALVYESIIQPANNISSLSQSNQSTAQLPGNISQSTPQLSVNINAVGSFVIQGQQFWSDTLIECAYFDNAQFDSLNILTVANPTAWAYGSTAMIQKISLAAGSVPSIPVNDIVGAFLLQKGAFSGRGDQVRIFPALGNWTAANITCASQQAAGMQDPHCNHLSAVVSHSTGAWVVANVTDLVMCQLTHSQPRSLLGGSSSNNNSTTNSSSSGIVGAEINLLWEPIPTLEQSQQWLQHSCRGPTERGTEGKTEWYSSNSADPPLLMLYYKTTL